MTPQPWKSKYRNQPVRTEEGYFASKHEYRHWCALKLREKAGEISHLQRQVKFDLEINGVLVTTYRADAVYFEGGRRVVADAKGVETPEFKIKSKLMKAILNIEVETV